jgi:hypothetical protein
MVFDFFRRNRNASSPTGLSVSRVHVFRATDRPMLDPGFSEALGDSLREAILKGRPECGALWQRSVEEDKVQVDERVALFLVSAREPLSIDHLTSYLQYQCMQMLENELLCSLSQQKGRYFTGACYHDPKATTGPDRSKLVQPWSMGSSEPNDRVDPVTMAVVIFFEE